MAINLANRLFLLAILALVSGCEIAVDAIFCKPGYKKVAKQEFSAGVKDLSRCLESNYITSDSRAHYLQVRAWAYYSLGQYQSALDDQEASYQIKEPTRHNEFINYASYLRKVGKYEESLVPLYKAVSIDEINGQPSMMTQYNLGWSLYEAGRYQDAITEFSKGIPNQPDYAFVFYRRGLAYDRIGETEKARADFERFIELKKDQNIEIPASFLGELKKVFSRYGGLEIETNAAS